MKDCNPVDAVECPHCSTVFQVRIFDTDGAGYAIWDGCETVPVFCPLCGGRIGGRRSAGYRMSSIASSQALTASNHPSRDA